MSDESQQSMSVSVTGALRDNKGKLPVHWVPADVENAMAAVLLKNSTTGGGKYPPHNWKKGAEHSTPLASLLRHARALADGERIDPTDGLPHSWKILCNSGFLVYYQNHFPQLDDLPNNELESKK